MVQDVKPLDRVKGGVTFSIFIPQELVEELDRHVAKLGEKLDLPVRRNQVIGKAIREYLARQEK